MCFGEFGCWQYLFALLLKVGEGVGFNFTFINTMIGKQCIKLLYRLLNRMCRVEPNLAYECRIVVEKALLCETLGHDFLMVFVIIFVNIMSKALDGTNNIPPLILIDVRTYKVNYPRQYRIWCSKIFYQFVDGLFLYHNVVKINAEVGGEVKFTSKVTKNGLKERINCLYAEVAVMMDELCESHSCTVRS